jgi:hypothetical protein
LDVANVTRLQSNSEKKVTRKVKPIWCSCGWLFLLALTQLAGCVSTEQVQLIYPPEHSRKENLHERGNKESGSIIPVDIILEVFDARIEKDRVGESFTLFGRVSGIYVTKESVTDYVQDAIKFELTEAGHTVRRIHDPPINDSAIDLLVDIQSFKSNFPYARTMEIRYQVTFKREGARQETRSYDGTGRAAFYLGVRKNFAEALAIALEDTILKMLVDLGLIEQGRPLLAESGP